MEFGGLVWGIKNEKMLFEDGRFLGLSPFAFIVLALFFDNLIFFVPFVPFVPFLVMRCFTD